jgi:nicotinamide mononucleotide transporter
MNPIFDFLFGQYKDYQTHHTVLEIVAVLFGLLSVWYAKQNKILVYPTGMLSTAIFVYLLFQWGLLGDMMINAYYFVVSVFGWYIWTRKVDVDHYTPISSTTPREKWLSIIIFSATLIFVYFVYDAFGKWTGWTAYVDTLTTGIFFVGMWLMAKRKIENWIYWIIGDIISVPLYLYKGLTFTSLQYVIFTVIAIYGYSAWKKHLNKTPQMSLK